MTPKYSLANLLLFTAFIGVSALAYSYHSKLKSAVARADALEAELNNSRPIAFGDGDVANPYGNKAHRENVGQWRPLQLPT
jgi:hypothetical protein